MVRAHITLGCDINVESNDSFYAKLDGHELFFFFLLLFPLQIVGICCSLILLLLPPPTNCTICFISYPFNFVMSLCIVTHKGRYYYITRIHYFISIHIVFWYFFSLSSDLTQTNMARSHIFFRYKQCTVEPQYNKGPRDWQNMFTIMRFLVKRFFSVYFSIIGKFIIPKFIIPKSSII